jgi:TolB-like protein
MPVRHSFSSRWLSLLLLGTVFLHAQDKKPLVAISPLQAKKVDPEEVDLISEALAGELQSTGAFRVMERGQMDRILKEQGVQSSGLCDGNECAVEVGKILGIDKIVVGSVGRIGTLFIINTRLVDVQTGEILASVRRTKDGELKDVLTSLVPQVGRALAMGTQEDYVATAPPPAPVTKPAAPAPVAKESSGGSALPWVLAGAALAGGGVAAFFLLQDDGGGSSSSTPTPNPDDGGGDGGGGGSTTVSIPVTW